MLCHKKGKMDLQLVAIQSHLKYSFKFDGCSRTPSRASETIRRSAVATSCDGPGRTFHATTPNGNTGPVAVPFCRARNSHDPAAAGHFACDGDRDQTSGCGSALAQGTEAGCQRGSQHGLSHAATAEAAWTD